MSEAITQDIERSIDVARRTTRGRSCPRCGGKIVPSLRSVYQNAGNPDGVFSAWQCERCSYEEIVAKPQAKSAGKPSKPAAVSGSREPRAATSTISESTAPRREPLLDSKGRELPADVRTILCQMHRSTAKDSAN